MFKWATRDIEKWNWNSFIVLFSILSQNWACSCLRLFVISHSMTMTFINVYNDENLFSNKYKSLFSSTKHDVVCEKYIAIPIIFLFTRSDGHFEFINYPFRHYASFVISTSITPTSLCYRVHFGRDELSLSGLKFQLFNRKFSSNFHLTLPIKKSIISIDFPHSFSWEWYKF